MENRFFQRVIFRQKVDISDQDVRFPAQLENISLGGLFICTDRDISPGEQIEITMPLRNEFTTTNFSARLTALRRERKGVAFKFKELDPKNFWTLQAFIKSFWGQGVAGKPGWDVKLTG